MGRLFLVAAGLALGWWTYVPLHELLHAAGCAVTGGSVEVLQIAPLYGGHLWAALFPFVEAGGEYAGRLSGFDTGGSDLVYLATDLAPFVLTLWPGLWALRGSAVAGRPVLFGFFLPFALAPLVSLTGDAYEIGSILTTNLAPWNDAASLELLRGDDVFAQVDTLGAADDPPWAGFVTAALLGLVWALVMHVLAHLVARALGRGPLVLAPVPPR